MVTKNLMIHDSQGNLIEEQIIPVKGIEKWRYNVKLHKIDVDDNVCINLIPVFLEFDDDNFKTIVLN